MTEQYQITGHHAAAIAASVEQGIREGALVPGTTLPPVRTLAARLEVSPATVGSAYRMVRERGFVETAGRRGTRVRSRPPVALPRAGRRLPPPPGAYDLSTGEPDVRLLPSLAPHLHRLAELIAAEEHPPVGYTEAGILPDLAHQARARFDVDGVPVGQAAVSVAHGALDAIERVLAAHLRAGDRVAVEDPGWANLFDLLAALGLAPVSVPVDDEGPSAVGVRAAVDAGARAVVVTARAHNPTGAAVSATRAAALRQVLAERPDTLVVEDDHAAELAEVPLHPLAGVTSSWAFVRSVSKPYGPDLRLAVLAGDETTVARVEGRLRAGAGWVSTMVQRLVVELWRDPAVTRTVSAAAAAYRRRREGLVTALAARGVTAHGRTGINVWVPVPDETRAVATLREAGYAVAPGALYRIASPPGVRITPAALDDSGLPPLADAVAEALTRAPAGWVTR